MKKITRSLVLLITLLAVVSPAWSQARKSGPTSTLTSALERNNAILASVETQLGRIEASRRVGPTDYSDIEKSLFEYAEEMKSAFEGALQQAQTAAESNGRLGSIADLQHFETFAAGHEQRIEGIRDRLYAIDQAISNQAIRDDTRSDLLQEFIEATAWIRGPWKFDLVNEAEASVAVVCVAVCQATVWVGCATCIAAAGPYAVQAWNTFNSCWKNARQPGRAWKRAACLSLFIIKLA